MNETSNTHTLTSTEGAFGSNTSNIENFYHQMKQTQQQLLVERTAILGTNERSVELDEYLSEINGLIYSLTPLYEKNN